ncbi:MAG: hypothetical protein M3Y56_08660 [Armatimonadota bacterium]|nr:hypothetical protein [Armatimonadota bacterium]
MSRSYQQELDLVRREYQSAKFAIAYVSLNWSKQGINSYQKDLGPEDLRRTSARLEVTYIIRLFATFEGLLKQYMIAYYPEIKLPDKPKVGWFISRVAQLQNPRINTVLCKRIESVRDCRNDLIHTGRPVAPLMTFEEAMQDLAKYLDKLPPPR